MASPTTPQAVSRVLSRLGYSRSLKNGSLAVRSGQQNVVMVSVYPGSPEHIAGLLVRAGYVCAPSHRSVSVYGKVQKP